MCGICGIVAPGRPPDRDAVERMSAGLAHRGPDGAGVFADDGVALAARRLAVLDPSDAGDQPFASPDGELQLAYNGEVYNYRELRRELEARGHRFRSETDTEVVLAAYREWGERCVERFIGMWAFAVWDGPRRRLFCSRDRFGVKPFCYRLAGDRFTFASEPAAIAAAGPQRLEANHRAVAEYVEHAFLDHVDETFFRGIRRLPPAHSLTFDERGLRLHRYWALEAADPPGRDAAHAVRELLLDSVRLCLRSDVPLATALSGGVDSSVIATCVRAVLQGGGGDASGGARPRTFTVYFDAPGFDERPYAAAVVDAVAAEPHWITFGPRELVRDLPRIVEAQGEPFGSTSIAAGWYLMRTAREAGVTVMLDGQGGDELLGGYRAHVGHRLADLLAAGRLAELSSEAARFRPVHGAAALAIATARPFAPEALTQRVRSWTRGAGGLVRRELRELDGRAPVPETAFAGRFRRYQHLLLTRRGLPELLRYEDRNSMAHSLEARVPFLDHRLVELCFSLPAGELIGGGRTKAVLRRAFADRLPPRVRDRRDKLGFVTPERDWFRGPLGDLAADVFGSPELAGRGWVDAAAARRRLARHRRGEIDAGMELWRVLNLELWARAFLDH
jgi:asparagine synthase (glutamine-hydrolysing)